MSIPPQKLVTEQVDGVLVVRVASPSIFDDQADGLRREFSELLADRQPPAVVLDLSEVSAISSLGVGVIMGMFKRVKQNHGRFALCSLSPFVEHVFQLCQLIANEASPGILPVYPDATAAVSGLTASAG